jgi:replicative DNA helicase
MYKYAVVFIVEGEIDALSVVEAGGQAVALGSTANKNKFISFIGQNKPECLLILSLDNDEAGKKTQAEIADALKRLNTTFLESDINGGYKDPNEHLTNNFEAFRSIIRGDYLQEYENASKSERETYKRKAAGHLIDTFFEEINKNQVVVPTGFTEFDKILDGGLYEGLYIIGAVSSLGKTTFALQVGDQMAQQGYDVLVFSLEMSRQELMAKSISRLTFLNCDGKLQNAKTVRSITVKDKYMACSQAEKDLIHKSANLYAEYGRNVYIFEGIGDIGVGEIKTTLQEHIAVTGRTPVIIIDYLQILASDTRGTDKQNTDKSVLELKRMSRDFKIPVIVISSFNRENYKAEVSMLAFKESGAIEYSSDVLLGLQFKGAGPDLNDTEVRRRNPREIQLKVLKNRNGRTGDMIDFEYYSMFNFFKEMKVTDGSLRRDSRKRV